MMLKRPFESKKLHRTNKNCKFVYQTWKSKKITVKSINFTNSRWKTNLSLKITNLWLLFWKKRRRQILKILKPLCKHSKTKGQKLKKKRSKRLRFYRYTSNWMKLTRKNKKSATRNSCKNIILMTNKLLN